MTSTSTSCSSNTRASLPKNEALSLLSENFNSDKLQYYWQRALTKVNQTNATEACMLWTSSLKGRDGKSDKPRMTIMVRKEDGGALYRCERIGPHQIALIVNRVELGLGIWNQTSDEVSHLCHNSLCINPKHLIAESGWTNRNRNACQRQRQLTCVCGQNPPCMI